MLKLKRVHNQPNKTFNFKIKTAGVLVVQIQSVCFNSSPKTAAACVVSRRRPDTNRKLQQELHGILQTHRHRNDKPPFYASLVVALYISVKMLYRAVFHLKKKNNNCYRGLEGDSETLCSLKSQANVMWLKWWTGKDLSGKDQMDIESSVLSLVIFYWRMFNSTGKKMKSNNQNGRSISLCISLVLCMTAFYSVCLQITMILPPSDQ